jgi:hypothetical protein
VVLVKHTDTSNMQRDPTVPVFHSKRERECEEEYGVECLMQEAAIPLEPRELDWLRNRTARAFAVP